MCTRTHTHMHTHAGVQYLTLPLSQGRCGRRLASRRETRLQCTPWSGNSAAAAIKVQRAERPSQTFCWWWTYNNAKRNAVVHRLKDNFKWECVQRKYVLTQPDSQTLQAYRDLQFSFQAPPQFIGREKNRDWWNGASRCCKCSTEQGLNVLRLS